MVITIVEAAGEMFTGVDPDSDEVDAAWLRL